MDKTQIDKAVSLAASIMGRKGGLAKVPKGASMLTPEERKERGRNGMAKRYAARAVADRYDALVGESPGTDDGEATLSVAENKSKISID